MSDYHSRPRTANRRGTLNNLKEQMYSLNMRMLLAMQNHDEETQEEIRKQMAVLQEEIDQMCLGGGQGKATGAADADNADLLPVHKGLEA